MGRLRDILMVIVALAAANIIGGCNTSGCLENRSSLPLAGFYSHVTGDAVSIDSLEITGIGASAADPLIKAGERISSVYLPMRATHDVTSWQFAYKWHDIYDGKLCDTITFGYTSMPYFAGEECGVIYKYRIESMSYTRHIIDSIAITDSLVTNTDVERIKIFFRTDE